jgi:putative sigma-54 modulation protein
MDITIEAPHVELSRRLKKEIDTKISQLGRMHEHIISCEVVLKNEKDVEQQNFHIEAKLLTPKTFLFAEEKAENFKTALDKLIENLKRQLHRHKEKLEDVRYKTNS